MDTKLTKLIRKVAEALGGKKMAVSLGHSMWGRSILKHPWTDLGALPSNQNKKPEPPDNKLIS